MKIDSVMEIYGKGTVICGWVEEDVSFGDLFSVDGKIVKVMDIVINLTDFSNKVESGTYCGLRFLGLKGVTKDSKVFKF